MLDDLSEENRTRLLGAMKTIESIIADPSNESNRQFILRPHEPGDMGWVIFRNAVVYWDEYKWDEALRSTRRLHLRRLYQEFRLEKGALLDCRNGRRARRFVFLVKGDDGKTAKLRLLIVEPKARGLDLGSRLVEECIRFAKRNDYEKMTLRTNSVLTAARHIYKNLGFQIVKEEKHHSFGQDLVGETWELNLTE